MSSKLIYGNGVNSSGNKNKSNIYWGEVVSVNDEYDSGSIKVRIREVDNHIKDEDLADAYPILPKFIHLYPQKGEAVRVLIENPSTPQKGRLWIGSVISQIHKLEYEDVYSGLSTSNLKVLTPDKSIRTYPDAKNVFPNINDVALLGKKNTDIILKENKLLIRVGKHVDGDIYKYNKENIGLIQLNYNRKKKKKNVSEMLLMSDKIAMITHSGLPNIKEYEINDDNIEKMYEQLHPIARADILVEYLEVLRDVILSHVHPYNGMPVDPSSYVLNLQKIDFKKILQKNILIN